MHNKYDFTVASQRLRKFVHDCKKYLSVHNVKNVCVAMTGDLMNSDRRLDEQLSQATNRAKAVLLSVTLLEQVLLDLQKDFNVSVAHVVGNESRITKDIGWVEEVASDNYDTIIHGMLKQLFKKSNVKFFDGNCNQRIVEIVGQKILLQHGHQHKSTNASKGFQSTKGLLASQGIVIDFVISGHFHNAKLGDVFAQGSSLAGANAFSNDALQLESRASQNLHIFFINGNRDSIKIDLQNVEGVQGYPIDKELEAYNAKSVNKSKKKVTVHKVVI
jgi:predicted phosphodiesterase